MIAVQPGMFVLQNVLWTYIPTQGTCSLSKEDLHAAVSITGDFGACVTFWIFSSAGIYLFVDT